MIKEETLSSIIIIFIGIFFTSYSIINYNLGSLQRIGPGFFPALIGSLLTISGFFQISGIKKSEKLKIRKDIIRTYLITTLSIILFYITLENLGLILSLFICSYTACQINKKHTTSSSVKTSTAITLISIIIFKLALGINVSLWPKGIG